MMPYFILVGTPAILAFYNVCRNDEALNKIIIDVFFCIWLMLLLLRKETVGIDLYNYSKMFQAARHTPYRKIFSYIITLEHEFGFYFLSKIVSVFTSKFRVLLTVISLISVIPIWSFYRRTVCKHPYLVIALFLNMGIFSIYFSCLRQVMAMSFVLPAYRYTQKKRPVPFILMVLLAFLFHKSAFILLLLYPIYHLKLKSKAYFFLIMPAIGICYLFRKAIFLFFRSFVVDYYTSNLKETGAIATLLLLILFLFFSYLVTDEDKMTPEVLGFRNILVMCTMLQIFASVNPLAMRLNYYYLLFVPLIIPQIAECSTKKNRTLTDLALIIMVCFFTVYYFYDAYTDVSTLKIYPYVPFWK